MDSAPAPAPRVHTFHAVAFVENLVLKELAPIFPTAKRTTHELRVLRPEGGTVFVYPFGAMVFHNVPAALRDVEAMDAGTGATVVTTSCAVLRGARCLPTSDSRSVAIHHSGGDAMIASGDWFTAIGAFSAVSRAGTAVSRYRFKGHDRISLTRRVPAS